MILLKGLGFNKMVRTQRKTIWNHHLLIRIHDNKKEKAHHNKTAYYTPFEQKSSNVPVFAQCVFTAVSNILKMLRGSIMN